MTHGNTKHGYYGTQTYSSWANMLSRGKAGYALVCEQWSLFEVFLADMGEAPEGMSIERRDNALGYEPSNCRWATRKEQSSNRHNVIWLTDGDRVLHLSDWAVEKGVPKTTLHRHVKAGKLFRYRLQLAGSPLSL